MSGPVIARAFAERRASTRCLVSPSELRTWPNPNIRAMKCKVVRQFPAVVSAELAPPTSVTISAAVACLVRRLAAGSAQQPAEQILRVS